MNSYTYLIAILALLVGGFIGYSLAPEKADAAAWPNTSATVATTSAQAVTAVTAELLFATSTANSCLARVITTQGDGIKLTFSDYNNPTPSNTVGHFQAASTTVAYDASIYGCNAVKVYSYGTQTLFISENR